MRESRSPSEIQSDSRKQYEYSAYGCEVSVGGTIMTGQKIQQVLADWLTGEPPN